MPDPAFLMHDDESGRCQMFSVGIPEIALVNYAKSIARPNSNFIDGGAHMGVYSILLADQFISVLAFEPQTRTYMQLCGNIFINEKENITPICAALTDKENANDLRKLSIVSDDIARVHDVERDALAFGSTFFAAQKPQHDFINSFFGEHESSPRLLPNLSLH